MHFSRDLQNAPSRNLTIASDEGLFVPVSPVAPNRLQGEDHIFASEFAAHAAKPRE
jgi:hypothetical protein